MGASMTVAAPSPERIGKSWSDYAEQYFSSKAGFWNALRLTDHSLQCALLVPSLQGKPRAHVESVRSVVSGAIPLFWFPRFYLDLKAFSGSWSSFQSARALASDDAARPREVSKATRAVVSDGFSSASTATEMLLAAEKFSWIRLSSSALLAVDGANKVTTVVADGAALLDRVEQLKELGRHNLQAASPREMTCHEGKKKLAWIEAAKFVASIALAIFSLGVLATGVVLTSVPLLVHTALALSFSWVILETIGLFYKNVQQDRQAALRLSQTS